MATKAKGLTIRQIIKNTPPGRRQSAHDCKIRELKMKTDRTKTNLIFLAKTSSSYTASGIKKLTPSIMTYVSSIQVLNKQGWVNVSCSCDDFWSVWEVALNKAGAADIEYSNGEKPVDKNPRMVAGCCIAYNAEVLTEDGSRRIQDIRPGDYVITMIGPHRVLEAGLTRTATETLKITTQSGKTLECTPDHRVYVNRAEATSFSWVEARHLVQGSLLVVYDNAGYAGLDEVVDIQQSTSDVYDLTVEEAEHFVANGVVVHNCKHLVHMGLTLIEKGKL